jgi:hypothetical protein
MADTPDTAQRLAENRYARTENVQADRQVLTDLGAIGSFGFANTNLHRKSAQISVKWDEEVDVLTTGSLFVQVLQRAPGLLAEALDHIDTLAAERDALRAAIGRAVDSGSWFELLQEARPVPSPVEDGA